MGGGKLELVDRPVEEPAAGMVRVAVEAGRRYLRLVVIAALSWSLFWFKKERDTPAAIAKQMLSMLRAGIED
jgi:hypothetical protein